MNTLRRHKYAILLAALLGVYLVESFGQRLRPIHSDLAMMAMMLLVFLIVFDRRADRLLAFIAIVVAGASYAAHYVLSDSYQLSLRLINHGAKLLLIGYATLVILRNVFAQRVVSADDVLGAVCGYLLAAGAFASVFLLIESFLPGSFSASPGFSAGFDTWHGRIAVLTNVSLSSLTSIGSSAAVAVQPPATILVPLETLFGQFYIAVVVAQLVGARQSQDRP